MEKGQVKGVRSFTQVLYDVDMMASRSATLIDDAIFLHLDPIVPDYDLEIQS